MTTSAETHVVEAAVGRFHELIVQDDNARITHRRLLEHQRDVGMIIDGHPVARVLRPRFMSETEHAQGCEQSALLTQAIQHMAGYALRAGEAGDLVRRQLALTPEETRLASMAPPAADPGWHSRLDGFQAAEGTFFVECNSHSSAGIVSVVSFPGSGQRAYRTTSSTGSPAATPYVS
ncbi:hypothetical protein [Streptomyces monashensis]|uniref:Uncharacterized protein n=1 Tax=Streptomyces monashensis TaxID=1678012 RepID=A0A1S2QA01_9ACTN|nr:hypothetical protein [Streptomyces monashensis]OIK02904.1 hypothetical protein BIV23_24060 [Streptomyces monashensis]